MGGLMSSSTLGRLGCSTRVIQCPTRKSRTAWARARLKQPRLRFLRITVVARKTEEEAGEDEMTAAVAIAVGAEEAATAGVTAKMLMTITTTTMSMTTTANTTSRPHHPGVE